MNVNQFFPLTRRVMRDDARSLLVVVIVYLIIGGALKIASWLLGWVPLLGVILRALFWVLGVYCTIGIVVAVLEYCRKENER